MIELLAPLFTIAVIVIAALWSMAEQAKRFDALTDEWADERREWHRERQELMDRIQAPEVVLHRLNANGVEPELAPVGDGPWLTDVPQDG